MAREANVDLDIYQDPPPALAAKIVSEYGLEAAATRWHWMSERRLSNIAAMGRAQAGVVSRGRPGSRASDDLDYAVGMEAAFALGSSRAGERAGGLRLNALIGHSALRGLVPPAITPEERGRNSRDGNLAGRGDAEAAARIEVRHAFEQAVGAVLRDVLPMVPDQPGTGRYRLPPVAPELAAALAGHHQAAVALVFPDLTEAPVTPVTTEPTPMTYVFKHAKPDTVTAQPVSTGRSAPRNRAPDPEQMRLDHAETPYLADLADRWGLSEGGVYQALRRIGLTASRSRPVTVATAAPMPAAPEPTPSTNVVAFEAPRVPEPVAPEPAPQRVVIKARPPEMISPAAPKTLGRLGVADLALAYSLACEAQIPPEEAIRFVRADVAAEAGSPGVFA